MHEHVLLVVRRMIRLRRCLVANTICIVMMLISTIMIALRQIYIALMEVVCWSGGEIVVQHLFGCRF